ncbi:TRAP transporter large permease subunit [Vibrio sp. PP-XX7]
MPRRCLTRLLAITRYLRSHFHPCVELYVNGGVAKRIIRFAIALVGWFRGGLAMASVMACMMFAALSGSSPATVVAIGSIVIAAMVKNGYSKEFAAGVICNAGTLGILIPPSIVMVVYAAATRCVSWSDVFRGRYSWYFWRESC